MAEISVSYHKPNVLFQPISSSGGESIVNDKDQGLLEYNGNQYKLTKIGVQGDPNNNKGKLFIIHEDTNSKKFVLIIQFKPNTTNTEPSLDAFIGNNSATNVNLLGLVSKFKGSIFPIQTDGNQHYSCMIGNVKLTDTNKIEILKNYTAYVDPTIAHKTKEDDGMIVDMMKTRICRRVPRTKSDKLPDISIDHKNTYENILATYIGFIALFGCIVAGLLFYYFFRIKRAGTDLFNNPLPPFMLGGKKPRARLA